MKTKDQKKNEKKIRKEKEKIWQEQFKKEKEE
jgi:hypothetical protein